MDSRFFILDIIVFFILKEMLLYLKCISMFSEIKNKFFCCVLLLGEVYFFGILCMVIVKEIIKCSKFCYFFVS